MSVRSDPDPEARPGAAGRLELGFWITGVALLGVCALAYLVGEFERVQAIAEFERAPAAVTRPDAFVGSQPAPNAAPIAAVAASAHAPLPAAPAVAVGDPGLARRSAAPSPAPSPAPSRQGAIALLRIPRIALEVPVFADTSERNLNRGAGWVQGTAAPGTGGNTAIAAHRDRHFRALKDVAVGDLLELASGSQRHDYRISRIAVVDPDDVSSLLPTATDSVTLVTCYPFYFVGHAPRRYIVRAELAKETAPATDWPAPTAQR